jgi:DNA mismatch repair protein MSH6
VTRRARVVLEDLKLPHVFPRTIFLQVYCLILSYTMARGIEGNEISTPNRPPKNNNASSTGQSSKGSQQRSILGFFQRKVDTKPVTPNPLLKKATSDAANRITPAPSSDGPELPSSVEGGLSGAGKNKENGLLTPVTPSTIGSKADAGIEAVNSIGFSSPIRKVFSLPSSPHLPQSGTNAMRCQGRKSINYAESDGDDEPLKPLDNNGTGRRASKRRKVSEDTDDEFDMDAASEAAIVEAGTNCSSRSSAA